MPQPLTVRPLAPACGAEIFGLDLADPSAHAMATLREALAQHAVVACREQHLPLCSKWS